MEKASRRTLRKQLRQGMEKGPFKGVVNANGRQVVKMRKGAVVCSVKWDNKGKISALSTTLTEKAEFLFRRHLGPRSTSHG